MIHHQSRNRGQGLRMYVMLGTPMETCDLVRGGLLTLSRAIILGNGQSESGGREGAMADADALFTYQSIAKVRPVVPIVCEINEGANVPFLSPHDAIRLQPLQRSNCTVTRDGGMQSLKMRKATPDILLSRQG